MFRVLLKIEKVNLKVIEPVQLHILIRKDHRFFTYCRSEPLTHGEARLTHNAEFLIDAKNPRFDIEVFLLNGETRKRGGVVPVNLKAFTINSSHYVVEPILKTPLTHSTLTIELVYMRSEYRLEEGLISVQRLQEMILSSRIKGVIDEHQKLIFHNNSLNNQVELLRQRNEVLVQQQHSLQVKITDKQARFEEEMILIQKTRQDSLNCKEDKKWVTEMIQDIEQDRREGMQGNREKKGMDGREEAGSVKEKRPTSPPKKE